VLCLSSSRISIFTRSLSSAISLGSFLRDPALRYNPLSELHSARCEIRAIKNNPTPIIRRAELRTPTTCHKTRLVLAKRGNSGRPRRDNAQCSALPLDRSLDCHRFFFFSEKRRSPPDCRLTSYAQRTSRLRESARTEKSFPDPKCSFDDRCSFSFSLFRSANIIYVAVYNLDEHSGFRGQERKDQSVLTLS